MSRSEVICGIHAVRHCLSQSAGKVTELWIQSGNSGGALAELARLAGLHGISVQEVPARTLDKLTGGGRHQGIALRRRGRQALAEADLKTLLAGLDQPPFLLILDGVQDPHNLGACLRTADAAGVDAVIVPRHRGVHMTPTVAKVACGAAERMPLIQVGNLARTLKELQQAGVWLAGTSDRADKTLFDTDLSGPLALVMGAEDRGVRRLTAEHCDFLMRIPMQGIVESLNVSVATAVCLFEAVRQRAG